MRHVVLLDTKISHEQYESWRIEDTTFWQSHLKMKPTYEVIRTDFTDYPTYIDSDGDVRPTDAYLKSLNDTVVAKYGPYGTDFIMMMVHRDNWKSEKIWGTNYSYIFGKQCFDYCRWDNRNMANTFGTAYHERMHSMDALAKVETGVNINNILGTSSYDREVVHGNSADWDYIRYKENIAALKKMAPQLRKAFSIREQKHKEFIDDKKRTIVNLITELVGLYRRLLYKKYGVPKNN